MRRRDPYTFVEQMAGIFKPTEVPDGAVSPGTKEAIGRIQAALDKAAKGQGAKAGAVAGSAALDQAQILKLMEAARDELKAKEQELAKLRAELERLRAELDRLRAAEKEGAP